MRCTASLGRWEPGRTAVGEDPSGAATPTGNLVGVAGFVTRYQHSRIGQPSRAARLCTEVLALAVFRGREPGWYRELAKPVPVMGTGFCIGSRRSGENPTYGEKRKGGEPVNTTMRMLGPDDAAAYRSVRRRALIEHPEAYSATVEELDSRSLEEVAATLASPPESRCTFGAFVDDQLVGLVGFGRNLNAKLRHRAGLYQMYTAPEQRRRGLGRQLVDAVIDHARRQEGLEELILAVTVGNTAAELLYLRAGFRPSHVEARLIKIDGVYYDILWMNLALR